jgi:hypothetical protein
MHHKAGSCRWTRISGLRCSHPDTSWSSASLAVAARCWTGNILVGSRGRWHKLPIPRLWRRRRNSHQRHRRCAMRTWRKRVRAAKHPVAAALRAGRALPIVLRPITSYRFAMRGFNAAPILDLDGGQCRYGQHRHQLEPLGASVQAPMRQLTRPMADRSSTGLFVE